MACICNVIKTEISISGVLIVCLVSLAVTTGDSGGTVSSTEPRVALATTMAIATRTSKKQ